MGSFLPLFSTLPSELTLPVLGLLGVILGASALISGLSGFGFSAIGATCLWLLPPTMAVPLLMALSTANQMMSLGQLKRDIKPIQEWWPDGPAPYLIGGLIGVPVGLALLHTLPSPTLLVVFGGLLVIYASYSVKSRPTVTPRYWLYPIDYEGKSA